MRSILITGGLGFIGSHTATLCIEAGYEVVIVDDLSNANQSVMDQIASITTITPTFYPGSVLDEPLLHSIFNQHAIEAVIHFAAFKSVNESVHDPLKYYKNNVSGTLSLLNVMKSHNVVRLIFSSSATVYDDTQAPPFDESMRRGSTHAYGQSKVMIEDVLQQLGPTLHSIALRYFNPVGAHPSGLLGESPLDQPNNLMPLINQVALQQRPHLDIFGADYPTQDGTAERDYIHVMDVAHAHLLALEKSTEMTGYHAFNIGTGTPVSVHSLVETYQRVNHIKVPFKKTARRAGDMACSYAHVEKARDILGFKAQYTLDQMCIDAYRFVKNSQL